MDDGVDEDLEANATEENENMAIETRCVFLCFIMISTGKIELFITGICLSGALCTLAIGFPNVACAALYFHMGFSWNQVDFNSLSGMMYLQIFENKASDSC